MAVHYLQKNRVFEVLRKKMGYPLRSTRHCARRSSGNALTLTCFEQKALNALDQFLRLLTPLPNAPTCSLWQAERDFKSQGNDSVLPVPLLWADI
jgi:hypothetical protein